MKKKMKTTMNNMISIMRTSVKMLAMASTFAIMNPVFAQDTSHQSFGCCDQSAAAIATEQIGLEPSQWAATGDELETINQLTISVQQKVQRDFEVTNCAVQQGKVRSSRHARKNNNQSVVF